MKKIILFLGFLTTGMLFCQKTDYTIKMSEPFDDNKRFGNILESQEDGNDGNIIVTSFSYGGAFSSKTGYLFEHYDSELKKVNEFKFNIPELSDINLGYILGSIRNDNKVSFFYFVYHYKSDSFICYSLSTEINSFNFEKKELFRLPIDDVNDFEFSSRREKDQNTGPVMIVNQNKTGFAISVDLKNKNQESHKIFLFDKALNKIFDHNFTKEVKDKYYTFLNFDVSNDNKTVYLLGKYKTRGKNIRETIKNSYNYEVTKVNKEGQTSVEFEEGDKKPKSLKTIILDDKLICVGFYSETNDKRYKGVCYFEFDTKSLEQKKRKYNPFSEELILNKYGKNKDSEMKNVFFREVWVTKKGEIILNAEEGFVTYHTSSTSGQATYSFFYGDLMSIKLDINGDLVWSKNIFKSQGGGISASGYMSFSSIYQNENLYFLMNISEISIRSDKAIRLNTLSLKKSSMYILKINSNGVFTYEEILNYKDNDMNFKVSESQIVNNSFNTIGYDQKDRSQLLKVIIE